MARLRVSGFRLRDGAEAAEFQNPWETRVCTLADRTVRYIVEDKRDCGVVQSLSTLKQDVSFGKICC